MALTHRSTLAAFRATALAGTSGMTETILQSRIDLPSVRPTGHITSLRARSGVGVDVRWTGRKLAEATLSAKADGRHTVVHAGQSARIALRDGALVRA